MLNTMDVISAATMLFLIMDPLGNIPIFMSILKKYSEPERRRILIRELSFALIILLGFLYLGRHLLDFLSLRQESISIAGGIILFLIALRMIFPTESGSVMGESTDDEPFLVPLAIPLIAGPSTLAALSLLSRSEPNREWEWLLALLLAWGATAIILLLSGLFYRLFKERGLAAIEKLMGMLLVAVSVQMFLDGVGQYLH